MISDDDFIIEIQRLIFEDNFPATTSGLYTATFKDDILPYNVINFNQKSILCLDLCNNVYSIKHCCNKTLPLPPAAIILPCYN
mmetsp:Transcript_30527/g.64886  ORF Transcript_30527/g.64886 Transcript_30527/m.64886 type:complete len:83 (-) Transcript_30527:1918-2166(-)